MKYIGIFLLVAILMAGCRKNKNPYVPPVPPKDTCNCYSPGFMRNDSCVYPPGFTKDEWGKVWDPVDDVDNYWHSATRVDCFDSCVIWIGTPNGNYLDVGYIHQPNDDFASITPVGSSVKNYWPSPTGDRVDFVSYGLCGDYRILDLKGTFNAAKDTLRAMVHYRQLSPNFPYKAPQGPVIFTKVKVVQRY